MMMTKRTQRLAAHREASSSAKSARLSSTVLPRRSAVTVAASASNNESASIAQADRRQVLLAGASLLVGATAMPQVALADETSFEKFLGYATPPTSYGGYGGNAKEAAKYTFDYPTGWKEEVPSKVEKGTQGVDGRVVNPRVKGQRAFVITLGRAGEDNKSFRLTDLDSTFQGFAGADYDLQDALTSATEITKSQKEVAGNVFYQYDIDSPETRYLASISVSNGKVFALFVKSPARAFRSSEDKLRRIIDTFELL